VLTDPFTDRAEAGRLLAKELPPKGIILALARGGVPVGAAVAARLHLPLDVIVPRKLGVPWEPELAMGAIAGKARIVDERLIGELGIAEPEIEEIVEHEQTEMKRREELYRDGRPAFDLQGQTAVLVDDGLATGYTMMAAVRHARYLGAAKLVVAVPVASEEACRRLRKEADEVICLATPQPFYAVGEWYRDFEQVSDTEVRDLLSGSRLRGATPQ
jgi:predicted phosphoribosyltransferase